MKALIGRLLMVIMRSSLLLIKKFNLPLLCRDGSDFAEALQTSILLPTVKLMIAEQFRIEEAVNQAEIDVANGDTYDISTLFDDFDEQEASE